MKVRRAIPPQRRSWLRGVTVAMALVAVATYWNGLSTPFIFDDVASIPNNPSIRSLWPLAGALSPPANGESVSGRPVVNLSFAVNYAAGGLDLVGLHLTNIAIHLLCALLVLGILRRTLASAGAADFPPPLADGVSAAIALVWMVHPLQSEAVTYVIGRTESLMAFFYLLTLYASIRGRGEETRPGAGLPWGWIAVVACALGMASKETMVGAPLMVACYDRLFVFRSWREAVRSRWRLYAGLAATWGVLALLMWGSPRAHSAGLQSSEALGMVTSPWSYLLNQAAMITRYLRLVFWPRGLVLDYGFIRTLTIGDVLLEVALVVAIALATVVGLARRSSMGFLGLWFFATLAPSSSVVPIVTEVGAERRMYLPSMAVITAVVAGSAWLARRLSVARGRLLAVAAASVCGLLMAGTMTRNAEYASPLVMWQSVVERWPGDRAHRNLAAALQAAGRHDEVIPELRKALAESPDAHYDLGAQLLARGEHDEAIRELEQFLKDRATHALAPSAVDLIAEAHARLGDAAFQRGDYSGAVPHYRAVADARQDRTTGWANLGVALAALGQLDDAIGVFERVVAIDPENGDARRNMANAWLSRREFEKAAAAAREAVRLKPRDPVAHDLLGLSLAGLGRLAEAAREFREALALDPDSAEIRAHLALVGPRERERE